MTGNVQLYLASVKSARWTNPTPDGRALSAGGGIGQGRNPDLELHLMHDFSMSYAKVFSMIRGMTTAWPDFRKISKPRYARRVWIPVYLSRKTQSGSYGKVGWVQSYEGVHSVVIPKTERSLGERYSWGDDYSHTPWATENEYRSCEEHWVDDTKKMGVRLVLRQTFPDREEILHLNQDFIIALGLAKEDNAWVRPSEGYTQVAREITHSDGRVCGIEIKAEFLADYLCARNSALRLATFRDQQAIFEIGETPSDFTLGENIEFEGGELDFHQMELDSTGEFAGSGVAVFRVGRTDVDPEDDVPEMGEETASNTDGDSYSFNRGDAVAVRLMADFRRDEWFEPASISLRVRHDDAQSNITFITDANGDQTLADDLKSEDVGRWLWFKPDVVAALSERRGAELIWYSKETGGISTPSDPAVHFGINEIGLVTVYAFDVARLPEWERRFWAGYNVSPEGRVSAELLTSQVRAQYNRTQAPEKFLPLVIEQFREAWRIKFGSEIMREHDHFSEILGRCHRFRALDRTSLFALAKDIARISADLIDAKVARSISNELKDKNLGSLKSLEKALATMCDESFAKMITGPLFATYDLRLQDAHPPKSDIARCFHILGIDENGPTIFAGQRMLLMVVSSFDTMRQVLEGRKN